MVEATEQKPPQAEGEKKEEKKKTTLDNVVEELSQFSRASTNTLLGNAAIGASTALFGLDGFVTAASFPMGAKGVQKARADGKGSFTTSNFRDEAVAGALFTPPLVYGVEAVKQAPKAFGLEGVVADVLGASLPISPLVIGGLTFGVLTPALTALYYPLQYLIRNKKFEGLGKHFKENYWKGLVRASPITALSSIAVGLSYAVPAFVPYLFPVLALSNIAYRVFLSPEKLNYLKLLNPFNYLPNVVNPFYLASAAINTTVTLGKGLASLVYNAYKALYDTGLALGRIGVAAPAPAR